MRLRGLPAGTFALLYDAGREISQALVADPRIRAVGFTGSRAGGTTFMAIAAKRRQPIPVYAEMSSINPVILFPSALKSRAASIATAFVSSGHGQFCANPGLILAIESESLSHFFLTRRRNFNNRRGDSSLAHLNGVVSGWTTLTAIPMFRWSARASKAMAVNAELRCLRQAAPLFLRILGCTMKSLGLHRLS